MNERTGLRGVIDHLNKGVNQPALSLVKSAPNVAVLLSKMVRAREPSTVDMRRPNSSVGMDQTQLTKISDSVKDRQTDNEHMLQLFPDLELASQILVSCVLSPKDMVNVDLIYRAEECDLPTAVVLQLTDIVRQECETQYDIKNQTTEMTKEVLFGTGSYIRTVIPESAVDEMINGPGRVSTESMHEIFTPSGKIKPMTWLGSPDPVTKKRSFGFESFGQHQTASVAAEEAPLFGDGKSKLPDDMVRSVDVVDNFLYLKMPQIAKRINRDRSKEMIRSKLQTPRYKMQMESLNLRHDKERIAVEGMSTTPKRDLSVSELDALIYKGSQNNSKLLVTVKTGRTTFRRSIGRPLYLRLPSMAVIPVHVPGDPTSHIGHFVLIDEEGNPLNKNSLLNSNSGIAQGVNDQNNSMTSFLLSKSHQNLIGDEDKKKLSIDQASAIYASIVEADLTQRLKNGIYGSSVELAKNTEVYNIMLARTYANQFTRLLYIPGELTTYFANNYYDNGVGKSLLDNLKIITSLRAILLFSKVMALSKNSIALTKVNMTLDPNDPDPYKTMEMGVHEIMKMRSNYLPVGVNSPADIVDWVHRSGVEFGFDGHPDVPQTKFETTTSQMQHAVPDSNLEETLQKTTIMGLGLTPDNIDAGFTAEFAITILKGNILLSKRTIVIQDKLVPLITDNVQKIVTNDYEIRGKLMTILYDNIGSIEKVLSDEQKEALAANKPYFMEKLLEAFIDKLVVDLPKPDMTTLDNQATAFMQYKEAVTEAISYYISTEMFADQIVGELSGSIETLKAVWMGYFMRRWMADNGYMTELADMVSKGEDGTSAAVDLNESTRSHIEGLTLSSIQFIKSMLANKAAAQKDLQNMGVDATAPVDDGSGMADDGMGGEPDGGDPFATEGDDATDPVLDDTVAEPLTDTPEE